MKSAIKFLLLIIIGFTIVSGALEIYRIVNTTLNVEEEIRTIALDAIELSLMDEYYIDGIHILDEIILIEELNKMIREKYDLDSKLIPKNSESMYSQFEIELDYDLGNFTINHSKQIYIQGDIPYLKIKGKTSIKPLVLNIKDRVNVNYDISVTTENLYKQ